MHGHAHTPGLIYLILIPLLIFVRLRRARFAARAADFWFEPEGDHFIYHPFGRFGRACLVSPATRLRIRHRTGQFARMAGLVLILAALGPVLLLSVDPDRYAQLRAQIVPFRLALVLAVLAGSLAWRLLAIRPLYAGAPEAPRRIDPRQAGARRAQAHSWWALGLSGGIVAALAVVFLLQARAAHSPASLAFGLLLAAIALLRLRALAVKWRGLPPA